MTSPGSVARGEESDERDDVVDPEVRLEVRVSLGATRVCHGGREGWPGDRRQVRGCIRDGVRVDRERIL